MTNATTPWNNVNSRGGPQRLECPPRLVDEWVDEGIITRAQGDRILDRGQVRRSRVPEGPAPGERSSLAVEALGYLGGVIVAVATMLIAAQQWADITSTGRLVIVGVATAALLGGGFAVPDALGDVGVRLRSVLWLASTVAVAGFLGLIGSEYVDLEVGDVALLTTAGTSMFAGALWAVRRLVLQQVAMMVALMVTAATAIGDFVSTDSLPGLGVWGLAAVWLLLGWGGLLGPRRIVLALGATAMVFGAMLTISSDAGIVLVMMTAAAIVFLAVLFRDLVLLAVGALGSMLVLPAAVSRWFPDSLAAAVALLAVGILLVGAAVWIPRRGTQRRGAEQQAGDYSVGEPAVALSAGAVVVVAVVSTVLIIAIV